MRLLRQSFQLLGRCPNQLILRTVQGTISKNQEGIEKRNDWILFQSLTPLLPELLARQLVALSRVLRFKPPFPKSYNPNVHCDYHSGIQGHSTEDCISLKKKVQTLIEVGKINFKSSNQLNSLLPNFFEAKTEEVRQNILSTKNEEFATISGGIQGRRIGCTTEKPEEEKKASELQKENEKLQRLVQDMAYMMTEQKESIAAIRRGI